MNRSEKAAELFLKGYNCAQSVVLAYSDVLDISSETLAMMSSSLGGGVGRLREACGALTGGAMVLGAMFGYSGPEEGDIKKAHYERVQRFGNAFEKVNGSLVCRELLNIAEKHSNPTPSERDKKYYADRPCANIVYNAVEILEQLIPEFEKEISKQ